MYVYCRQPFGSLEYIFEWRDNNHEKLLVILSDEHPDYYLVRDIKYFSESGLKRQGLKSKHIKLLGEPCLLLPNPRYRYGNKMKLHSEEKVNKVIPF